MLSELHKINKIRIVVSLWLLQYR